MRMNLQASRAAVLGGAALAFAALAGPAPAAAQEKPNIVGGHVVADRHC
jgi:hypothetical protein